MKPFVICHMLISLDGRTHPSPWTESSDVARCWPLALTTSTSVAPDGLRAMGLMDKSGKPIIDPERGKKTLAQGVSTIVLAATSPLLDSI